MGHNLCNGLQVLLLLPDMTTCRTNSDFEERIRNETKQGIKNGIIYMTSSAKNKFNSKLHNVYGVPFPKVRYFSRIRFKKI